MTDTHNDRDALATCPRTVDESLPCSYCCAYREATEEEMEAGDFVPKVLDPCTGETYAGPMSEVHPGCQESVNAYMQQVQEDRKRGQI